MTLRALTLVALATAAGCGDNRPGNTPAIDAATMDAAPDAAISDAAIDAQVDAAIDAPTDAPIDAPTDAPIDAAIDAPTDAMIDAADPPPPPIEGTDPSFGTDGWVALPPGITRVAVQPDGKILLCGRWSTALVPGNPGLIARLLPDGSYDPSFGTAGRTPVREDLCRGIAVLADGRIVATGAGVTVLAADGAVVATPSSPPTHSGLTVLPLPDGGFVVAGTQVYLPTPLGPMTWRSLLVRYTPTLLPQTGFGNDGVAAGATPDAIGYHLVDLAATSNGTPHVVLAFANNVSSVAPGTGAVDGAFSASLATGGAGLAVAARGDQVYVAYSTGAQAFAAPLAAGAPAVQVGAFPFQQPFFTDAPVLVASAGGPIVTPVRSPDTRVRPVRLTASPFAIDQAWTANHSFELPGCGQPGPCTPAVISTTSVSDAAMAPGDQLVVLGWQTIPGGSRAFVARLTP